MQSGVVTGLLTGHNLTKYFYQMGMIDSPSCRRCEAEEETSVHVLCEWETLETLMLICAPFSLDPEVLGNTSRGGAIWNFIKGIGLPWIQYQCQRQKGPVKKGLLTSWQKGLEPITCSILYNILYTVSTQQYRYSNIMYVIGYTMATCFDRKRSSSGQYRTCFYLSIYPTCCTK